MPDRLTADRSQQQPANRRTRSPYKATKKRILQTVEKNFFTQIIDSIGLNNALKPGQRDSVTGTEDQKPRPEAQTRSPEARPDNVTGNRSRRDEKRPNQATGNGCKLYRLSYKRSENARKQAKTGETGQGITKELLTAIVDKWYILTGQSPVTNTTTK